jgi:hypothetical protein
MKSSMRGQHGLEAIGTEEYSRGAYFFSLPRQIARRIDRTYERFLYLVSSLLPLIGSRV